MTNKMCDRMYTILPTGDKIPTNTKLIFMV